LGILEPWIENEWRKLQLNQPKKPIPLTIKNQICKEKTTRRKKESPARQPLFFESPEGSDGEGRTSGEQHSETNLLHNTAPTNFSLGQPRSPIFLWF
jgi:hypothetical protein